MRHLNMKLAGAALTVAALVVGGAVVANAASTTYKACRSKSTGVVYANTSCGSGTTQVTIAGKNGVDGKNGKDGATGATGAQGIQGIQGIQGVAADAGVWDRKCAKVTVNADFQSGTETERTVKITNLLPYDYQGSQYMHRSNRNSVPDGFLAGINLDYKPMSNGQTYQNVVVSPSGFNGGESFQLTICTYAPVLG